MGKETKRATLIETLKNIMPKMRAKLEVLKEGSKTLERPDFIWNALLGSFSTMGNSRGYFGLIATPANYNRVTFEHLSNLSHVERLAELNEVLRIAGVRMSSKKAAWLNLNYDSIIQMGGLEETKNKALDQVGTEAKVTFLMQFQGIGEKYGRNIWMDVYHPDFHNTIAIDDRIKQITKELGYSFKTYEEHERFYQILLRKPISKDGN